MKFRKFDGGVVGAIFRADFEGGSRWCSVNSRGGSWSDFPGRFRGGDSRWCSVNSRGGSWSDFPIFRADFEGGGSRWCSVNSTGGVVGAIFRAPFISRSGTEPPWPARRFDVWNISNQSNPPSLAGGVRFLAWGIRCMVYGVCMLYRIWCIEPVEPPWLARGGFDRTSRTPPGYGHGPLEQHSTAFYTALLLQATPDLLAESCCLQISATVYTRS